MTPRRSSPLSQCRAGSITAPLAGTCRMIGTCSIYKTLNLSPHMEVWKKLYCRGSYTACRHFNQMDDGLLSP